MQRSTYHRYKLLLLSLLLGSLCSALTSPVVAQERVGKAEEPKNPPVTTKEEIPRRQRRSTSSLSRAMKRSASDSRASWMPPTGSPTRKSGSRKESSFSMVTLAVPAGPSIRPGRAERRSSPRRGRDGSVLSPRRRTPGRRDLECRPETCDHPPRLRRAIWRRSRS